MYMPSVVMMQARSKYTFTEMLWSCVYKAITPHHILILGKLWTTVCTLTQLGLHRYCSISIHVVYVDLLGTAIGWGLG